MRVFISATKDDLDPDCRPTVRRAIAVSDAQAETMEEWNAEYLHKPVALCLTELKVNSTHFVGVFAHRLGWVPPNFTISITEAEFEWALEARPRKQIAVYMPKPGTAFDKILEQRADAKQTIGEKEAQAAFRKRVLEKSGTVVSFESDSDLGILVSNRITLWNAGGLRGFVRGAAMAMQPPLPVHLLGRRKHEDAFKAAWEMLAENSLPGIAGFVLHGPPGAGQSELIERFSGEAETGVGDQLRLVVRIGATWQRKDLGSLLEALGRQLQPGWVPRNPAELGSRLVDVLADSEVVVEIHDVHRFPRALAGAIEDFWQPLRAAFPAKLRQRCTIFFVMDGAPDAAGQQWLFDPAKDEFADYVPQQVIGLPALGGFTLGELKSWMSKLPAVPPDPDAAAQTLFDETNGDPARLLSKLKTEPLT